MSNQNFCLMKKAFYAKFYNEILMEVKIKIFKSSCTTHDGQRWIAIAHLNFQLYSIIQIHVLCLVVELVCIINGSDK